MAANLKGPVGLRGRVQNVANFTSDQAQVIDLLSSVPASKGGKAEAWANPPLAGPNGACPQFVADAIWDFQSFWKARGAFHNIDGVVDPGGHTLAQLNNLADGGSGIAAFAAAASAAGAAGGAAAAFSAGTLGGQAGGTFAQPAPVQGTSIDAFTRGMQSIFGHPTNWSFSGSAGGGGGLFGVAAGAGKLDFLNTQGDSANAPGLTGSVGYVFVGASAGVDGGPDATFSYSTPSMWSAGVGNIRSRTADPLALDDFTGAMCVASITAISQLTLGHGGSITFYMLGLPTIVGVVGLLEGPLVLAFLTQAAVTAKALGTMVGASDGVDTGFTIAPGFARLV